MSDALSSTGSDRRILIIDDEEDSFHLIRRLLRRVGATEAVEWCRDGERGLSRLDQLVQRETLPTLVILDLQMPGLSGHAVLAALKNDPRFSRLFVVVVSSSSLPEDIARAIQLGAFCYFEKYPTPEKFARVYEVAKERLPAVPTDDGYETALREIIDLVENALTVCSTSATEYNAADRELLNTLGTIRRRATARYLDRLNPPDRARWPFPSSFTRS
ncbi:MAG TPA: response regulator [Opitutaceae bacterium]|nr:response regulator [Opitutaceae bacterium]